MHEHCNEPCECACHGNVLPEPKQAIKIERTNMTDLIWGVDLQNDFCVETGKLYVPGAHEILPNVRKVSGLAAKHGITRVMSADDHTYGDDEIVLGDADPANGLFNPHCMRGTLGAMLVQEAALSSKAVVVDPESGMSDVRQAVKGAQVPEFLILKQNFDVFTNTRAEEVLKLVAPDTIYVYGVATDVCVDAAVKGLIERGHNVVVVVDAIAGLSKDTSTAALDNWVSAGVGTISTEALRENLAMQYGEAHFVDSTDEAQSIRP